MTSDPRDLKALADQLPGAAEGVSLDGDRICVRGAPGMAVPQDPKGWMLHEAPAVWPNTPHGEARPTLLFGIVKDAGPSGGVQPLDSVLRNALESDLPGDSPQQRHALAAAMRSKFWTTATGGGTKNSKFYLLPLHAQLPLSFRQEKAVGGKTAFRYKMFRGTLLPFLLSGATGEVDRELLDEVLGIFSDERDLTRLDRKVLEIASVIAPRVSSLDAETLLSSSREVLNRLEEAGGPFCTPSLDEFRRDLKQVLTLDLPRRDLIHQLTLLLALHLTTRLYRAGLVLSLRLDRCVALFDGGKDADPAGASCAVQCCGSPGACDLSAKMRFRVGSGSFRSVRLTDPCVTSYRDLTSNYLLPLPVTISTANFARRALEAAGGPVLAPADLEGLYASLAADSRLRLRFDAVVRLLAVCKRYQTRQKSTMGAQVQTGLPGLHALRLALLESRRTTMRHEGRDIVHQLAKEVRTGRLIASNGNAATFFEVDEDMLHLLVRLVCGSELLSYGRFLEGLRRYGLAPQNQAEEQLLQSALSRLGMLRRYSDAGESAYVHHSDASNEEAL